MKRIIYLALMLLAIGARAQYTYEAHNDFGALFYVTYDLDDENVIYACSEINHIVVSYDNGMSWQELYYHTGAVSGLKALPGGTNICFGGYDPVEGPGFFIVDTETGLLINHIDGPNDDYSPQESWYDVAGEEASTLLIYTSYATENIYQSVYYTTTSGDDWDLVYDYLENDGFHPTDVAICPTDPSRLFIPLNGSHIAEGGGGLLISEDGGESWDQALADKNISAFAVNPLNPDDLMVSLYTEDDDEENQKVLRSLDAGQTWNEIPMAWLNAEDGDDATLFIGYNPLLPGAIYMHDFNELAFSLDNGVTWNHKIIANQDYFFKSEKISPNPFHPEDAVIMKSDYSIRTPDGGLTINRLEAPYYPVYGVAVRTVAGIDHLYYNGKESCSHRSYDQQPDIVYTVPFGKNTVMQPDSHVDGRVIILEADYWVPNGWHDLFVSFDHGATRTHLLELSNDEGNGVAYLSAYASDPGNPDMAYVLLRTLTEENFRLYRFDMTNPDGITNSIIPLPAAAQTGFYNTLELYQTPNGTVLLVSFENKLYQSYDLGITWSELFARPTESPILDIALNPLSLNTMAVAAMDGLHITEDSGTTWTVALEDICPLKVKFSDIQEGVIAIEVWPGVGSPTGTIMYYNNSEWSTVESPDFKHFVSTGMDFSFGQDAITAYIGTGDMGVIKFTFEMETMGIEHPSSANQQISLVPNPAKDNVRVHINAATLSKVSVYTVSGQKLTEGNSEIIDISALSSGVYLIQVETLEGGRFTKKLVKE